MTTVGSASLVRIDEAFERGDLFKASEFLNPFRNVEGLLRGRPTFPVSFVNPALINNIMQHI